MFIPVILAFLIGAFFGKRIIRTVVGCWREAGKEPGKEIKGLFREANDQFHDVLR